MRRIWYTGDREEDKQFPGVKLSYGTPVDVPDAWKLGEDWAEEMPEKRSFVEIKRPEWRAIETMPGVGGATASKFRTFGITTISELAGASDELLAKIAEQPGTSEKKMRTLRSDAQAQIK